MTTLGSDAPLASPAAAPHGTGELVRRSWAAAVIRNRNGRIGSALVALVALAALLAALGVTPYPPDAQNMTMALQGVSLAHPFGTDQFGRDILSMVMQGLEVSLAISFFAVLIAGGIGTLAGIVAGFIGGWIGTVIMRVTDILFAIPAILLALAIVTALGAGWLNSAIAIGAGYVPIFVRVARGPVLALREADYVRAGRVLGFSRARLLVHHVLPNVAGVIAVQISLALAWSILAEASLSFLGLGPPPPVASLGEMVSEATSLAGIAWWTLAGPSLAIVLAIIGFNFLGDGLRDAADPRARTR
jgi:peptide/nickel transport system permease protein